ncbi:hypothetical protein [Pseudomonas putida]|uniref:hypothetical protein n=1 Tax=Pseudomonas putida TaxID=303 RepID=UPI00235D0712|nr:hypothetical protein [Pseudomonas putida]GLO25636.1 hypothetical protein PPUJ21368_34650 [Pseudomonas putida]HDS0971215.1 hypothetical protein [Pseudomonas putida]
MSNVRQDSSSVKAMDQLRLTRHVSLELIKQIHSIDLQIAEYSDRLDRQQQDLDIALRATANAPEERARVGRQESKLEATQRALETFDQTANVLAGALFQLVKQAMSIVHGSNKNYPNKGRAIHNLDLCDLVWQARNQAMHFEATKPDSNWANEFYALNAIYPGKFSMSPPHVSRAKAIFDLLGWQDYKTYGADVMSLLIGNSKL